MQVGVRSVEDLLKTVFLCLLYIQAQTIELVVELISEGRNEGSDVLLNVAPCGITEINTRYAVP